MQEHMDFEELQEIVSVCLDEIVKLKADKEALQRQVADLTRAAGGIVENEKKAVNKIESIEKTLEVVRGCVTNGLDNIPYEVEDAGRDKSGQYYPRFYAVEETIDSIVNGRKSLARFGDGEFSIMSNESRQSFQRFDERLAARLIEVIRSNEEGMLIAIANHYGSLDRFNDEGKLGIRYYMTEKVRKQHKAFLDMGRTYHDTYITRPYALFADNHTDAPKKRFENLKRIWDKREVLIVEGSQTRLGVGNDLFANAAGIRRIEAPATHSFDKYDEILAEALRYAQADTLFLIALGPSAGVLAYDLFRAGHQALDIGHVDMEYEWYLRGAGGRCEVKHKYNNEYPNGNIVEDIRDEAYEGQVLCRV